MFYYPGEGLVYADVEVQTKALLALQKLTGIDPTRAIVERAPSRIPPCGLLLSAIIVPGNGGSIYGYAYAEKQLKPVQPEQRDSPVAQIHIHGGAQTAIACLPPKKTYGQQLLRYPVPSKNTTNKTLSNGREVIRCVKPVAASSNVQITTIPLVVDAGEHTGVLHIARVARSLDEAYRLARSLGEGMGLVGSDRNLFVDEFRATMDGMEGYIANPSPDPVDPSKLSLGGLWGQIMVP